LSRRRVQQPDGTEWTVGRRWSGRQWPRLRRWWRGKRGDGWLDAPFDIGGLDDLAGAAIVFIGLVLAVVFVLFVVPLLVLAVEVVVAVLLIGVGVLGRILFRRPWVIEAHARRGVKPSRAWRVVGWRESARVIEEVGAELAAGHDEPRPLGGEALH
jgi:hypothetical protein